MKRFLFSALVLVAACPLVAQQPTLHVYTEPRFGTDTTVRVQQGTRDLLFGFSRQVVDSAGIPITAPARSYCTVAVRTAVEGVEAVLVDSVVTRTDMEMPRCGAGETPLLLRPTCELTLGEHATFVTLRAQPAVLVCGVPPQAFYFPGGGRP